MVGRTRRPVVKLELLRKSREAALNAVQTFNNPLTTFKAETFIVLMVIAWTYLLHAYYRQKGVEYRYHEQGAKRRKFVRKESGAYKYWELGKCLDHCKCPLDGPTKKNLRFLIGLRNEIEHHQSVGSDDWFSARYLACCLNYERFVCELFGKKYSLDSATAFTLQFRDLRAIETPEEAQKPLPSNVAKYVQEFDAELTDDEFRSPHFRRVVRFEQVVTNSRAQADKMIRFVQFDPEFASESDVGYQDVYIKKEEKEKYLPSRIVELIQKEGFLGFRIHHHTELWQSRQAKKPGKGYGIQLAHTWYWYERWLDEVRKHCAANRDRYAPD